MIYKIFYKEWQVFDISLTLCKSNEKWLMGQHEPKYYSEIHSYIVPEGFAHYIYDNVVTKDELQKVIFKFREIDDLRIVLWESLDWDNKPLYIEDAEKRETKVFRPFFEKEIKRFCKEFKLGLVID